MARPGETVRRPVGQTDAGEISARHYEILSNRHSNPLWIEILAPMLEKEKSAALETTMNRNASPQQVEWARAQWNLLDSIDRELKARESRARQVAYNVTSQT